MGNSELSRGRHLITMKGGATNQGPSQAKLTLIPPPEISDALQLVGFDPLELLGRCAFPDVEHVPTLQAAVSGGQDSLALVVLAKLAGHRVVAHHVDHGIRPESASEFDALRARLEPLGVELQRHEVVVHGGSNLEERARQARFSVLPPDIATGHTADDQAETLLINLMRGSGIDGLGAMELCPRHPILGIRRWETLVICRALKLEPIVDPSNFDLTIQRNRVRHELMPLLSDISNRDITTILYRTAGRLRSDAQALDELIRDQSLTTLREARELPAKVVGRVIRREIRSRTGLALSGAHTQRVIDVIYGRCVGVSLPRGFHVGRSKGRLLLRSPAGEILWELI